MCPCAAGSEARWGEKGCGQGQPCSTNCAAVTGQGNQLNPGAGGQAPRQARQTRVNECDTINNFGEEAIVNRTMAPKVKGLPAVGKGERSKGESPRRGIGRNGVLQPGGRHFPLFPCQLREQPRAMALTPQSSQHAGAWALMLSPPDSSHPADTGTAPQTPAYSQHISPTTPQPHAPTLGPSHSPHATARLAHKTPPVFSFSPLLTPSLPPGPETPCLLCKCFSNRQPSPSLPPSLLPLPLGSIRGEARAKENEWGCLQKAAANSWGMPSPTPCRVTAHRHHSLRPSLPHVLSPGPGPTSPLAPTEATGPRASLAHSIPGTQVPAPPHLWPLGHCNGCSFFAAPLICFFWFVFKCYVYPGQACPCACYTNFPRMQVSAGGYTALTTSAHQLCSSPTLQLPV